MDIIIQFVFINISFLQEQQQIELLVVSSNDHLSQTVYSPAEQIWQLKTNCKV